MTGALLFVLGAAFAPGAAGADAPPGLRLPAGVAPVRYAAELWIDPGKETFRGKIEIEISLKGETGAVWLNAKELDVRTAAASRAAGGETIPGAAAAEGENFVRITFQRNLSPGPWSLSLDYGGRVSEKSTTGVFREKDGADWYVYTQFEALDARRAFPCFDEPSFKTPWQLTIHGPKGSTAVSNTPVVSETEDADGGRAFTFAPTKPLPSYLVAFGVGPFEVVDAGRAGKKKTPIRVLVPRGRAKEAAYAAATSGPLLEELERYFGIPFPFEKLDELVIPETVAFGAMENAGLVTYSSRSSLAKPAEETAEFRRTWARYCAHETAHQWFGDDVTMAWWDDLWLNEAFASWMDAKIVDRWKPEWKQGADLAFARASAMGLDSLTTARRIRQPIVTEDDIDNAFDAITYDKGAAVIGMFERWVGEETFRLGVQAYLRAHAGGNATSDDFVSAIASAAKNPAVIPAFRSFLDRAGVPLVTVDLLCDAGAARLALSQKRFLPAGSTGTADETWQIPVCARTGDPGADSTCALLSAPTGALPLGAGCPARVLANAREGYYRVSYRGSLLSAVLEGGGKHLTVEERIAALSDVGARVRSGDLPVAAALGLAPAFADDPEWQVVEAAKRIVALPKDLLVPDALRARYEAFVRDVLGPRARALGWTPRAGESDDTHLLRAYLVRFVADEGEDPSLVAEAGRLARAWLSDRRAVDPLLAGDVLAVAAEHGDAALFRSFLAEARRTQNRRERERLLGALGSFRDPALVKEALALTLSKDFDARETIRMLSRMSNTRETRVEAWDFLKENFDGIVARLPHETPAHIPFFYAGFSDEAHKSEVEAFFRDRVRSFTGAPRILAETLEVIHLNAAFQAAQGESMRTFLNAYDPKRTLAVEPRP